MHRIERAIIAGFLVLAAGLPGRASDKKAVTVDEAAALAAAHSLGLAAGRARVDEASARTREAAAVMGPALRFNGGYTRLSEVPPFEISLPFLSALMPGLPSSFVVSPTYFNTYTLRLSLQQPVFAGFRLKRAVEASRLAEQAAVQDGIEDKSGLEAAARTAYWNAYRAVEMLALADENRERVEAHRRNIEHLLGQGLATRGDVLKAQAELASADLRRVEARTGVQTTQVLLASLLGLPLDTEFELLTTEREVAGGEGGGFESGTSLEALLDRARTARAGLKALEMRAQAARTGVDAAKAGVLPQVFLGGNYYYMRPNSRLLPSQDKFYATWDLGLTVSYDIWNGRQTAQQVRQAQARRIQAEDALGLAREQIDLEVTQAWLAAGQARERIAAAAAAVQQAEESCRTARDRFQDGVAISSDVLDAEVLVLQAKTSRTQAVIDLELARIRLRLAAGM